MSERPIGQPEDNVYTILLMIASVIVLVGTIYLVARHQHFFGTWNPFTKA
jgi:hypothetical protein